MLSIESVLIRSCYSSEQGVRWASTVPKDNEDAGGTAPPGRVTAIVSRFLFRWFVTYFLVPCARRGFVSGGCYGNIRYLVSTAHVLRSVVRWKVRHGLFCPPRTLFEADKREQKLIRADPPEYAVDTQRTKSTAYCAQFFKAATKSNLHFWGKGGW